MVNTSVFLAISRLREDLPKIIGHQSGSNVNEIDALIDKMESSINKEEKWRLALQFIEMVSPFPKARQRMFSELYIRPGIQEMIFLKVIGIARSIGADRKIVSSSVDKSFGMLEVEIHHSLASTRILSIKPGGLGGGKSVKLKNLHLDISEMSKIAAGFLIAGYEIIDNPHPLLIVAGCLLIVQSLTELMVIEITELEASVFWGLIQAIDEHNCANLSAITSCTNNYRNKIGLEDLTSQQTKYALSKLQSTKVIEVNDEKAGIWQVMEKIKIIN